MEAKDLLKVGIVLIVVGVLVAHFDWEISRAIFPHSGIWTGHEAKTHSTGIVSIVAGGICVIVAFFNVIKKGK